MNSLVKTHIFLVEDDKRLAQLIKEYLEGYGFRVSHEQRGDLSVEPILREQPELVILDLMLPGLNGIEVFKQLQPSFNGRVLMLTARDGDVDQILGLELGADDYVIKPVQPRVLLARIKTLLRRQDNNQQFTENLKILNFGALEINRPSRQVTLSGEIIELTTNEFELLWFIASQEGQIVSRDHILNAIRGIDYNGVDRWVDIRISRLRNKLKDNAHHPQKIKTIWGKGYLFVRDAW